MWWILLTSINHVSILYSLIIKLRDKYLDMYWHTHTMLTVHSIEWYFGMSRFSAQLQASINEIQYLCRLCKEHQKSQLLYQVKFLPAASFAKSYIATYFTAISWSFCSGFFLLALFSLVLTSYTCLSLPQLHLHMILWSIKLLKRQISR